MPSPGGEDDVVSSAGGTSVGGAVFGPILVLRPAFDVAAAGDAVNNVWQSGQRIAWPTY
jgi:hypothetical protein